MGFIKSTFQILAVGAVIILAQFVVMSNYNHNSPIAGKKSGCDKLVMYSTTWCPACKLKRRELNQAKIAFKEHFVDKDPAMNRIFERKVRAINMRVGYPTLEINGKILRKNYSVQYLMQEYNLCKK